MKHFRKSSRVKATKIVSGNSPVTLKDEDKTKMQRNVVRALFEHFQKWKPEVVTKTSGDGFVSLEVKDASSL